MKKLTFLTAILLATTTFAQIPNYVPTNGLVGWWPFNGNANDESGNGNNGTVNGATLTSDRNGVTNKAYSFDGNDWIEILDNSNLNNSNITINFWINSSSSLFQQIIYKVSLNTAQNEEYSIPINLTAPNQINFDLKNNSCSPGIGWISFINNNVILSNWQNIAFTHDGIYTKFYLNGNLINSQSANFNIANCPGGKLLFGIAWNLQNGFNGKLDDIGIWNRALTQQEITNLYNGVYNLPVELTQFSASCSENTTTINWQTASENNSAYFEVLQSRDGETWTSKTTTPAAGNSTSTIDYSFTDYNEASLVYYKLKQVDKDGQYIEYGPISANCNENTSLFISPNPTNGEFNLIGMEHFGTITSLEIKDASGKVVKVLDPTTSKFSCESLKAGIYFLNSTSGSKLEVVKIIKE
jgi:hypothetical protein